MNNLLTGAVAGTVATVPMTIFWEVMHERMTGEPPRPLPPREVAEALVVKAGVSRQFSETEMEWLSMALHFGYGALTGAVYGTIAPRHAGGGIFAGALFGLGVWTASYLGWLPAAGVRHSPRYDMPARTRLILSSHLLWGAATGLLLGARPRSSGRI